MATKKELIKDIKNITDDKDILNSLKSKTVDELEQILDYEIRTRAFETPPEEDADEIAETEVVEPETVEPVEEEKPKVEPVEEYVEHKTPSELSRNEQRAYARTGILPIKKK